MLLKNISCAGYIIEWLHNYEWRTGKNVDYFKVIPPFSWRDWVKPRRFVDRWFSCFILGRPWDQISSKDWLVWMICFIVFLSVLQQGYLHSATIKPSTKFPTNCSLVSSTHNGMKTQLLIASVHEPRTIDKRRANLTHWGRGHLNCLNARSQGF
jgi:hypothetical protein